MGGTLTVTPNAQRVASSTGQAIFISNTGGTLLYLSSTQDVSPTNFHAVVGVGGSVQWPGGQDLYVCCPVNSQGSLSYLDNGATVDSGSVLAQSSNQPVLLHQETTTVPAAAGTYSLISQLNALANKYLDVSTFASVSVRISVLAQGVPPALVPANRINM